jgi:MSHA biogenesis protein MshL
MKHPGYLLCIFVAALSGCAGPQATRPNQVHDVIQEELKHAAKGNPAAKSKAATSAAINAALLPPLQLDSVQTKPGEQRFDLAVQNAPASQIFMGIVSGTPYSMLVSPEVSGTLTLNLKNVTVKEALDAIRDLYGYEYRVQGKRIWIQPNTMQTRVFQINYLAGRRQGVTDTQLISNNVTSSGSNGSSNSNGNSGGSNAPTLPGATNSNSGGGSRISTTIDSDFWKDLKSALATIVGEADGRSVVMNPGSGVIVVRALPRDMRNVEAYLKATQTVIERQVMLEAKIIEVALSSDYQAGINWAAFRGSGSTRSAFGVVGRGSTLQPNGPLSSGDGTSVIPGLAGSIATTALGNGLIGLAFQTPSFAALLNFLESQGNVQVLSSPRIATLNNQKAVLKVGSDDFFVTNVTSNITTGTGATTSSPNVTLQPFFSGISLDVTPQVDEGDHVMLHVHPVISTVTEKTKTINLGTSTGSLVLPLASSSVNESDSIVRVEDGYIVAIGGLMKQKQSSDKSQLPGVGDVPYVGGLFGQRSNSYSKSELVILIKPTIIRGESSWEPDLLETQQRVSKFAQ